ncbi:MAG: T9SS type A sorting domain-containing protein [Bacteroidota bacterium]
MKRATLLLLIFACGLNMIHAQSWISSNMVSSSGSWKELDSRISLNDGLLTYGYFDGTLNSAGGKSITSNGDRDYYLINFSQDGNVEWMKSFGSSISEYITGGLCIDTSGNIFISGGFQGLLKASESDSLKSTGSYDIFIIKLNDSGNTLWARNAGTGAKLQASTALEIDSAGDLILAGIFNDSISIYNQKTLYSENETADYFYGKFKSSDGNLLWVKQGKSLHTLGGRIENIYTDNTSYLFTGNYNDSISFGTDTLLSIGINSDVHLISTDLKGKISWIRKLRGVGSEFSYSVTKDDEGSIYISGFYASDTLIIDNNNTEYIKIGGNRGSSDLFIAKYSATGNLEWMRTNGSKGTDKTYYMEFFGDQIHVSGSFADTLIWGEDTLISKRLSDTDMFVGAVDKEGIYQDAIQYRGSSNSNETGKEFFKTEEEIYTLMRTDADRIIIGDSTYNSVGNPFYMILGVKGCLPISIDNVITQDVSTCYGDSKGAIRIFSTGGFGEPFTYSIDNGMTFSNNSYLDKLPAGDYQVVVKDKENCKKYGGVETIKQPDSLMIELVSTSGIAEDDYGVIVVAALGGLPPYTFTLQPGGVIQDFGTYTFAPGEEGEYVVEVNDAQNCGPVSTDTIAIIVLSDGVDLSELGVKLYPNPSSGAITLEMPFEGVECTIEVLSLTGQIMLSRQAFSNGGMINENIDLTNLSKGMYMIRVDGQTLKSGVVLN